MNFCSYRKKIVFDHVTKILATIAILPHWCSKTVNKLTCVFTEKVVFSAESTIGMVWGLTALKHYGNKALRL